MLHQLRKKSKIFFLIDSNEYNYRKRLLDKLNREIILIKNKTGRNNRLRKKSLIKREEKKTNIVNYVIFYSDIKSHDIVRKNKNKK